jgi:hypothetical protein
MAASARVIDGREGRPAPDDVVDALLYLVRSDFVTGECSSSMVEGCCSELV